MSSGRPPTPPTPQRAARVSILGQRLLGSERTACLRSVRRVLRAAKLDGLELGVTFVHDLEMRALNRAWRARDKATDVLSFAAQEGERVLGTELVLGDLVISVDTARRQARALGHTLDVELAVLVAHGLCHLAGLDHERGAVEARIQAACEQTLLACAGIDVTASLTSRAS